MFLYVMNQFLNIVQCRYNLSEWATHFQKSKAQLTAQLKQKNMSLLKKSSKFSLLALSFCSAHELFQYIASLNPVNSIPTFLARLRDALVSFTNISRLNGDEEWIKLDSRVHAPRGPVKIPMDYFLKNNWNTLSMNNLKPDSKYPNLTTEILAYSVSRLIRHSAYSV